MLRTHRLLRACLFAAGALAAQEAPAADPHAHGVARLDVAIDGATITLLLVSPLESLLGFEHAPRTDAERTRVREMARALRAGGEFAPTASARCRLDRVTLASPALAPELLGEAGAATGKRAGEHAELDATFIYRCEDAKALQSIDVMLFDRFRQLQRIDVQVAQPKGQSALKLTARSRRIRW